MKFKKIFEGNRSAYGQLVLSGETTDKGKAIGKAFITREKIPEIRQILLGTMTRLRKNPSKAGDVNKIEQSLRIIPQITEANLGV